MRRLSPVLLVLVTGCLTASGVSDQASSSSDAGACGSLSDAGASSVDAASASRDAAVARDAGASTDAAVSSDAEAAHDAAVAIAVDAATDAAIDASSDAGADTGSDSGSGASCGNNVQDADETDIDCGGGCAPCAFAQQCELATDCAPDAAGCDALLGGCTCAATTRTCVASHCVDQRQDDGESDVDCGGACKGCGPGKDCVLDADCSHSLSGCDPNGGCYCDAISSTCIYSHCFDHKLDASESDVDCGGNCAKCALGQSCTLNFDCASGACDGLSAKCVSNQCADHHVDGDETDVDCGGTSCPACIVGKKCTSNTHCLSGFCAGIPKTCQ